MSIRPGRLVGGVAVGALAVGAYALGARLGPPRPVGHNLLPARPTARAAAPGAVVLASTQTVQAGGPRQDGGAPDGAADSAADGPGATFQQVYDLLHRDYVEGVPDDSKLAHGAAAAMLASLRDPASRFLEPAQMAELRSETQGTFHGLGAVLAVRKAAHAAADAAGRGLVADDTGGGVAYRLTIVAPLPGSPAEKAGLRAGDVITAVNGQWVVTYDADVAALSKAYKTAQAANDPVAMDKVAVAFQKKLEAGLPLDQAEDKLADPAVKSVTLAVTRAGVAKPLAVTVDTSAPTTVTPVTGRLLPGGIGYIKVVQFTDGADKTFASTLAGFGTDLKGLVLDLRDCPGGLLDVGEAIAAQVTSARSLGVLQTKGRHETVLPITPAKTITCPVTVLVNGGTANTAELLAAAVRAGGGTLIGQTTFGDATDVKPVALRDGSGFTMTVGQLFTPAHAAFAGVGLRPDVVVPDAAGTDAPLNRALGQLAGRVARLTSVPG